MGIIYSILRLVLGRFFKKCTNGNALTDNRHERKRVYMKKRHYDKSVYRSFALVLQVGINMLVPICMMTALGIFLDGKLGTSFWMIILFFLGAAAGGQNSYRMVKQILASPKENRQKENRLNEDRFKEKRAGQKENDTGNVDDRDNQESK